MHKADLIERVDRHSRKRYGVGFNATLLNDLIKDNLIPAAARKRNIGKRPVHDYDYRAYRRALQIVRLIKAGFAKRDAQRIQLFMNGYGLDVSDVDVRIPLRNEYVRSSKSIFRKARSGYFDDSKQIAEKHKQSLAVQLGEPDERFGAAGLTPSLDQTIGLIRTAKQGNIDSDALRVLKGRFETAFRNNPSVDAFAQILKPLISGMLIFESDAEAAKDAVRLRTLDTIEGIILNSKPGTYLRARDLFRKLDRSEFNAILDRISPSTPPEARQIAAALLFEAIASDPQWTALALTACLVLAANNLDIP
jgi:hypothetical protein